MVILSKSFIVNYFQNNYSLYLTLKVSFWNINVLLILLSIDTIVIIIIIIILIVIHIVIIHILLFYFLLGFVLLLVFLLFIVTNSYLFH